MPKADIDCLRELFDLKGFDPVKETVAMLKPIYGRNDALRALRKTLHQVLIQWMSCRQLYAEPEFYCVHERDEVTNGNAYQRAAEHNGVAARNRQIPQHSAASICQRQYAVSIACPRRSHQRNGTQEYGIGIASPFGRQGRTMQGGLQQFSAHRHPA